MWHRLAKDLNKEIIEVIFNFLYLDYYQRDKAFADMQPEAFAHMSIVTASLTRSSKFPNQLFGLQFKHTPPLERRKMLDMNTNDPQSLKWTCKQ